MKLAVRIAAVLGFLGVTLGAFGAHIMKEHLTAAALVTWNTAVLYQLIHSVASLWAAERNTIAAWLWMSGIVLFSGSLYVLAVHPLKWLGPVTPLGGLFFLAGWIVLVIKPR